MSARSISSLSPSTVLDPNQETSCEGARSDIFPDFDTVKKIAGFCKSIDDGIWLKNLEFGNITPLDAIRQCKAVLQRLCTPERSPPAAAGFSLPNVLVSRMSQGTSTQRMESVLFELDPKKGQKGDLSFPLGSAPLDFYLMHGNHICHLSLSPNATNIVEIPSTNPNQHWNTTLEKIEQLTRNKWNNCFIVAQWDYHEIIPIPY